MTANLMIDMNTITRETEASTKVLVDRLDVDPDRCMHDPFIDIRHQLEIRLPHMDPAEAHLCRMAFANLRLMRDLTALSDYRDVVADLDGLIGSLQEDSGQEAGIRATEAAKLADVRRTLLDGDVRTARRTVEETYGTCIASLGQEYLTDRGRKLRDEVLRPSGKTAFLRFVDQVMFLPDRIPGI